MNRNVLNSIHPCSRLFIIIFITLLSFSCGRSPSTSEREAGANAPDSMQVFVKPDKMPQFEGHNISEFGRRWISKQIIYPAEALKQSIKGKVIVAFIVEKDGSLSNVRVVKSIPLLDEEALRVIKSSPKWTPGMNDNIPVRVGIQIPILFQPKFFGAIPAK
jgi:TonB family protein